MTDISKEYAAALFALARESGQEREFSAALALIDRALAAQPEYAVLLSSPNVPLKERLGLLAEAFGAQVPEYVLSFTQLLCEKGHIRQFSACVQEYEALHRALSDVSAARIVSAVALTEEEKAALVQRLTALSGHTVEPTYEIDGGILGGVVVYMDDRVIDGSLRHKFSEIKEVIAP